MTESQSSLNSWKYHARISAPPTNKENKYHNEFTHLLGASTARTARAQVRPARLASARFRARDVVLRQWHPTGLDVAYVLLEQFVPPATCIRAFSWKKRRYFLPHGAAPLRRGARMKLRKRALEALILHGAVSRCTRIASTRRKRWTHISIKHRRRKNLIFFTFTSHPIRWERANAHACIFMYVYAPPVYRLPHHVTAAHPRERGYGLRTHPVD